MGSGLEVVAHPSGPWLVRADGVVYAVPAALGRVLKKWHGQQPGAAELSAQPAPAGTDPEQWATFMVSLATALAGGGRTDGHRLPPPIWVRVPLLPAQVVRWLAGRAAPLAGSRGLAALALVGLAGYGHLAWTAVANPIGLGSIAPGLVLGLFLLTAMWHEMGHAAAIAGQGYPPGGIGVGLLFVVPVLFADVTAVGVLPRAGRARVDVAGVVFQFGLGGVLASLGLVLNVGSVIVAAWLALLAVGWSLFPFIRADGYWLVCDLVGVEELAVDPDPAPTGWRRRVLSGYRLANAVFLLGVGFLLPWRYGNYGMGWLERLGWDLTRREVLVPIVVAAGLALGFVWWNILRRVVQLVRAAF